MLKALQNPQKRAFHLNSYNSPTSAQTLGLPQKVLELLEMKVQVVFETGHMT